MFSAIRQSRYAAIFALTAFIAMPTHVSAAEPVKIGFSKVAASAAMDIAKEKGYFDAEGLAPEFIFFDAAQAITVAVASHDLDFGLAGLTSALYTLGNQGALRIIAAGAAEAPGFKNVAFVVSNRAYDAGLKSLKNLSGHSVGITQVGTLLHYDIGLVAEKYGIDLKTIHVQALQSNPNIESSLTGGQTDAGFMPSTLALSLVERGNTKLLGWAGDEVPGIQVMAVFTSTKAASERQPFVQAFLRAYKKGLRDYHNAFTGVDNKRKDGPAAAEMMGLLTKFTGQSAEQVAVAIPYVDPEGRLNVKDMQHQVDWYKAQGMMKPDVSLDNLIDKRYVVALP
jgi:NitT/TauT family transport system substrate-binding protein